MKTTRLVAILLLVAILTLSVSCGNDAPDQSSVPGQSSAPDQSSTPNQGSEPGPATSSDAGSGMEKSPEPHISGVSDPGFGEESSAYVSASSPDAVSETFPEEPSETSPEEPSETSPEKPSEPSPEESSETSPEEPSEDPKEPEEPEDPLLLDKIKPTIRISADEKKVRISQGEPLDLLRGVTGNDNLEGNLTHKIEIDKGDFDGVSVGEFKIRYTLKDRAGNQANPVTRTVIVRDSTVYAAPPVFTGAIPGEVLNPKPPALFGGAWYHKVVSSKDQWIGIEGTITLPEVQITRYDGAHDPQLPIDPAGKNLDNPSVYLGGNALSESDVGLSLSRGLVNVQKQTLSVGCVAFRPFWRYITSVDKDAGGYDVHDGEYAVSANGNNCIANYHWSYTEFYYLPGDKLRIVIYIPEPGKMQLQIEVIEKSALSSSVETRERYGWKDPQNFKSPIFSSPGHGTGISAEYKRVNAIDQVANEGKTAIPTDTEIKNAVWHNTYLYREIDGVVYRVPMDETRKGVLSAPDQTRFTVSYGGVDKNAGGEVLTIHPGYAN